MRTLQMMGWIAMLGVLALSCFSSRTESQKETAATERVDPETRAMQLMQANCFTCHNPDLEIELRIAPPMFKIRDHYIDDTIRRESFVRQIVDFVNDPTEERAVMYGAIRNFGLMPRQQFNQRDLKLIAEYLYDNDVSSDAWYAKWDSFQKRQVPQQMNFSGYEEMGLQLANGTKAQLGSRLLGAIQSKGTAGAVSFCNIEALPLTDSMSKVFQASIRRVSDKPRNPANSANSRELSTMLKWKGQMEAGEPMSPVTFEKDGMVVGHYPIMTSAMCMQCHGQPGTQILQQTQDALSKLYPADQAKGYGPNQLRGIFVVEMSKREKDK
ncbi:MAG: hypothetical protein JPMHGGIA_01278 [Saprospiraceae bacterium]|nr:hypothetical protein [Saprospiraceae bacterium]